MITFLNFSLNRPSALHSRNSLSFSSKVRLRLVQTLLGLIAFTPALETHAVSLFVGRGSGTNVNDAHLYYGGSRWTDMTQEINAVFNAVTVGPDLTNLGQLLAHDRLWVDSRAFYGPPLSQVEINNIKTFVNTGRRVVMMGERDSNWSSQILGIVGGAWAGEGTGIGVASALPVAPTLTDGVGAISFSQNGFGQSSGGTPLFDRPWSSLWGNNVVTALDVNVWNDQLSYAPSARLRYARNVISWLAAPEPNSATLVLISCGALASFRLRRSD